ncbi:MAG TPA: zf-HC2 domain-containing protein [Gemmatimonadales bacterium]|nr:zf-HC2 domain-containing protein [Gemmatimonadales bacterium]
MTSVEYPPGWTCAQITIRLERYLLGTLPRGESLAIAEHIEACVWCGQALVLLRLDRPTARG